MTTLQFYNDFKEMCAMPYKADFDEELLNQLKNRKLCLGATSWAGWLSHLFSEELSRTPGAFSAAPNQSSVGKN